MNGNHLKKLTIVFTLIISSSHAYAYLDPGTGSILLQGAIAGIATLAYATKLCWHRIKVFISSKPYGPLDLSETDDSVINKDSETRTQKPNPNPGLHYFPSRP